MTQYFLDSSALIKSYISCSPMGPPTAKPHGQTTRLSVTQLPYLFILGLDLLGHQLLPHGQHG